MLGENLQHVPVKLQGLGTVRILDGSLDELLILFNTSLVNDRMRIHGCSLGSNVLPAELQPFIESDDTGRLEIHGVEHFLTSSIFLSLSLIQVGIRWCISISSWHCGSCINQLGEGCLARKTILVGVSINKKLEKGMIHLGVRVAFLLLDSLLHEPDEILLGLVKGVNGSGRHFKS